MRYYKTWQEALLDFIAHFGHNYKDSYTLTTEFEDKIGRNVRGVWYMYFGEDK